VALDTANYLGLNGKNARAIAADVGAAVAHWRDEAAAFGLTKSQTDRMASAFEHEDLALASTRRQGSIPAGQVVMLQLVRVVMQVIASRRRHVAVDDEPLRFWRAGRLSGAV
jgi:hypothetical protein